MALRADDPLVDIARATVASIPERLLNAALVAELHPGILDAIAPTYASDTQVMLRILALPQLETVTAPTVWSTATPAIKSVALANGNGVLSPMGGEVLLITGTGFLPIPTNVTIGGVTTHVVDAKVLSLAAAASDCFEATVQLSVVTPQGAGSVNVTE